MKNIWFVVILFLPLMLSGQDADEQGERGNKALVNRPGAIGFGAGISFSKTLRKGLVPADSYLPGYSYEMSFQYQFSPHWFLSSGVHHESKGHRTRFPSHRCYNYLSIPLMINIQSGGRHVSGYAGAGGYGAYLLKMYSTTIRKNSENPSHPRENFKLQRDRTDAYERIDLGLAAQTGVKLTLNECAMLDLQVRFTHGLISSLAHAKILHRSLFISLSFQYRF